MKLTGVAVIAAIALFCPSGVMSNVDEEANEPDCDSLRLNKGACTKHYSPVCGTDGNSYANDCLLCFTKMLKRNLKVKHKGECTFEEECQAFKEVKACTLEFRPVCGTDFNEYPNKCTFCSARARNANLRIRNYGTCPKN